MHAHRDTYIHARIHSYVHTYIHAPPQNMYARPYIHKHVHTYAHTCIHTHTYILTCVQMYIQTDIFTSRHAYRHAYIHPHIPTHVHGMFLWLWWQQWLTYDAIHQNSKFHIDYSNFLKRDTQEQWRTKTSYFVFRGLAGGHSNMLKAIIRKC